jgi:hypothetical protein
VQAKNFTGRIWVVDPDSMALRIGIRNQSGYGFNDFEDPDPKARKKNERI